MNLKVYQTKFMLYNKTRSMKKLIFIFFVVSANSFGQKAINFIDTNATWNVARTYPHGNIQNPNFVETITKTYGFRGDTVIGTEVWRKFYMTRDTFIIQSSNLTKAGFLCEKNRVILFRDLDGTIDTLYNFNLHTGDSVKYTLSGTGYYIRVSDVDTIIIQGSAHKRFYFTEPPVVAFDYLHEVWIEGIGSIHGPLFPASPTKFSTELPDSMNLTCYKIKDTVLWYNHDYTDCFIDIILPDNISEQTVEGKVFPNPVNDELNIEFPHSANEDMVVSVFDLAGKPVLTQIHQVKRQLIINTGNLKNSFYILQIESGINTYRTKFIKQ